MKLTPMTEKEYEAWSARSRKAYAEDKMKANSLSREEAEKIAADDFGRLLPEGLGTKNQFLFSGKDEEERHVGTIWFGRRGPAEQKRGFIYDIIVEPEFRGKGYGRKMMELAEAEARKQGIARMGLHVFGYNKVAIGLYESLGYETTDLVMEKPL